LKAEEALLILGMTLVTFLVRYPVLTLVGRIKLSERIIRALRFVPVAVLSAIVVPELLIRDGVPALTLGNAYLFGGLVAILVAWRWNNLLITIVAGAGGFMLWRALFGAM
jgi:branched-subunit amino acid transport protein